MTDTEDTQQPSLTGPRRPAGPTRIALTATAGIAAVLLVLWLGRTTPWSSNPTSADRGIAEPGLTLYPAGDREPAPPLEGRTLDNAAFNTDDLTARSSSSTCGDRGAARAAPNPRARPRR
ncbi:hypothetical protein [Nocardioides zhouii]|uniref:Uncharacterized protein n=1 Tax=Nocardioides zhouii TaxID=1168729 RepID=A0A4Q2T6S6_9ACTN|nr:hypothetical protein [Nocardioides zhouii]RYC14576.1 hypothetical protein EUA94_00155 [Nocardioides zhouii]